jgi:hypothetical protein
MCIRLAASTSRPYRKPTATQIDVVLRAAIRCSTPRRAWLPKWPNCRDGEVIFFAIDPATRPWRRTWPEGQRRRVSCATAASRWLSGRDEESASAALGTSPVIGKQKDAGTKSPTCWPPSPPAGRWACTPGSAAAPASRPSASSCPTPPPSGRNVPESRPRRLPATDRSHKEERHGSFPYPRPARPQPVEPAHGDRGHRHLRAKPSAIADLPGFEARLRERFPELGDLIPSDHLDTVSMAHALEFAALGLQAQAGCPVTFSRTAQTIETGVYQVVVEYTEEDVGRLAFELAEGTLPAALDDTPFDLDAALKQAARTRRGHAPRPETGAIVYAAVARGIPYRRLTEGSLVQFGWGSKQKRIQAAETEPTSAIAEAIAQDKELTKKPAARRRRRRCRSAARSRTRTTPGQPPRRSAGRWSSSRRMATRARVSSVNLTPEEQVKPAYARRHRVP